MTDQLKPNDSAVPASEPSVEHVLMGTLAGDPEPRGPVALGGLHGHRIDVTVLPQWPDGDPRNLAPGPGNQGIYRLTFVLRRPGIALLGEYEVSSPEKLIGDSHLALKPPATSVVDIDHLSIQWFDAEGHRLTFVGRPNGRGFLGRIETEIEARSFEVALRNAYGALAQLLSVWALQMDVPLEIFQFSCTEMSTSLAITSVVVPFAERPFLVPAQENTEEEFRAYASLYRQALNSNSAPYQFLCLFKIIEAIVKRRETNKASPARTNREALRSSEKVPENETAFRPWLNRVYYVRPVWQQPDLDRLFPAPVRGWKFGRVIQERLRPVRQSIAHALAETGELFLSVDVLVYARTVEAWLPLTKLIARRMLKNEFPDEFLVNLGEDGQITRPA